MAAAAGSGTEERLELELEPAEGAETPLVWKQRGEELPLGCSGFPWGFFLGLGLSVMGPCPDGSLSCRAFCFPRCCRLPCWDSNATGETRRKKQQVNPKPSCFWALKRHKSKKRHSAPGCVKEKSVDTLPTEPPFTRSQPASRFCL